MPKREPNRMVPTHLLRELRDAQQRQVDSDEVRAIIREIDVATGLRKPDARS